jgi:hypothetical protein
MADLEVAKHTKKVYKIWKRPENSLKHKITETLVEIAIIVFAITLSLWLHNWSEHNHLVQEEKEFLQGLKVDLEQDLKEMQADKNAYEGVEKGLNYFYSVSFGAAVTDDSVKRYSPIFYNTTRLNSNDSRFQGLKASGKIGIIENKILLNSILEFYQEDIPMLNYLNDNFNNFKKQRLEPFLDQHLELNEHGTGNWQQVLQMPEARNQMRRVGGIDEIINQYQKVMEKCKKIISLIKKQEE